MRYTKPSEDGTHMVFTAEGERLHRGVLAMLDVMDAMDRIDAEANTNTVPNVRQAQLPRAHAGTTASKGGQDDTRHGNPRALSVRALAQDKQDGAQ